LQTRFISEINKITAQRILGAEILI